MNAQLERPPTSKPVTPAPGPKEPAPPVWPILKFLVVLLLAGWIVFAHGCHGDEDNELFGLVRFVVGE